MARLTASAWTCSSSSSSSDDGDDGDASTTPAADTVDTAAADAVDTAAVADVDTAAVADVELPASEPAALTLVAALDRGVSPLTRVAPVVPAARVALDARGGADFVLLIVDRVVLPGACGGDDDTPAPVRGVDNDVVVTTASGGAATDIHA